MSLLAILLGFATNEIEIDKLRSRIFDNVLDKKSRLEANIKVSGKLLYQGKKGVVEFRLHGKQQAVRFDNMSGSLTGEKVFGKVDCIGNLYDFRLKVAPVNRTLVYAYCEPSPSPERAALERNMSVYLYTVFRAAYTVDGFELLDFLRDDAISMVANHAKEGSIRLDISSRGGNDNYPSSIIRDGFIIVDGSTYDVLEYDVKYKNSFGRGNVDGVKGAVEFNSADSYPRVPLSVKYRYYGNAFKNDDVALTLFERDAQSRGALTDADFTPPAFGLQAVPGDGKRNLVARNRLHIGLVIVMVSCGCLLVALRWRARQRNA